ncbi:hypothetical protein LZD49_22415 [Dyadobacter sp. CY261]|uniref:hypothetical protein n=1 Tax=Dyadobacter sp. CY261 TaxID=2907203 RepID=UPI001F19C2D1|nr:hypothetical protein [Dyadobacter sp. CY261]MCF0073251.1 hypothetical protein [Dyadobacter sp. CY261]
MFIVISKVIGAAVLGGLLLFAIPFLIFKALFFFLFLGLIFRLISGRRRYRRWRQYHTHFYDYPNHLSGGREREYLTDPFRYSPQKI